MRRVFFVVALAACNTDADCDRQLSDYPASTIGGDAPTTWQAAHLTTSWLGSGKVTLSECPAFDVAMLGHVDVYYYFFYDKQSGALFAIDGPTGTRNPTCYTSARSGDIAPICNDPNAVTIQP